MNSHDAEKCIKAPMIKLKGMVDTPPAARLTIATFTDSIFSAVSSIPAELHFSLGGGELLLLRKVAVTVCLLLALEARKLYAGTVTSKNNETQRINMRELWPGLVGGVQNKTGIQGFRLHFHIKYKLRPLRPISFSLVRSLLFHFGIRPQFFFYNPPC